MPFRRIPIIDGIWGFTGTDLGYVDIVEYPFPALCGFETSFVDSDHHLRRWAVGAETDARGYLFELSDSDNLFGAHDRVHFKSRYFNITSSLMSSSAVQTISGRGSNFMGNRRVITRPHRDDIFVLRGFRFEGLPDRNHHISKVEVRYDYPSSTLRVNFHDSSPEDDTYIYFVYYMFVRPSGEIPLNYSFDSPNTLSFTFTNSAIRTVPGKGRALLSGFNFAFSDGDHHIQKIAIDLYPWDQIRTTFTDLERTHPVEATIDYVSVIFA